MRSHLRHLAGARVPVHLLTAIDPVQHSTLLHLQIDHELESHGSNHSPPLSFKKRPRNLLATNLAVLTPGPRFSSEQIGPVHEQGGTTKYEPTVNRIATSKLHGTNLHQHDVMSLRVLLGHLFFLLCVILLYPTPINDKCSLLLYSTVR